MPRKEDVIDETIRMLQTRTMRKNTSPLTGLVRELKSRRKHDSAAVLLRLEELEKEKCERLEDSRLANEETETIYTPCALVKPPTD